MMLKDLKAPFLAGFVDRNGHPRTVGWWAHHRFNNGHKHLICIRFY